MTPHARHLAEMRADRPAADLAPIAAVPCRALAGAELRDARARYAADRKADRLRQCYPDPTRRHRAEMELSILEQRHADGLIDAREIAARHPEGARRLIAKLSESMAQVVMASRCPVADLVHRRQPTRRTCGQTVCAMLAGVDPEIVIAEMHGRGTSGADLIRWLRSRGFVVADAPRRFAFDREVDPRPHLPPVAIVRVDWSTDRRRTHWILWAEGRFWDPDAPIVNGADDGFAWLARGGRIYSILPVEVPRG